MPAVNDANLLAFGKIVHLYAEIEWGVRCVLAGILEIPLVEALVASDPYSASTLKNVVKSATKLSRLSKGEQEEIIQIVGNWGAFAGLRNAIAHRRWEAGTRPDSIRPVGVHIRSGKPVMIGDTEDRDWIEAELVAEAQKLYELNQRALAFYHGSGMADVVGARNKERENTAT
ncbi:hypothetical protein KY084_11920 [Stakelama sp. CBK3Z-3]|uniref:DUF4145 domain-containing protein n=1 Tax=Stakelama flava TaxID=2860338 RepID=A0ABS6XQ94_9SPHN|nr:hypothetical protein [Stakelama flava]MBW4331576.1 hypothetical protein [Stakelama flava]